jgi:hypothetical protein
LALYVFSGSAFDLDFARWGRAGTVAATAQSEADN